MPAVLEEVEDPDLVPAKNWLEALNRFLPRVRSAYVVGATVHEESAPSDISVITVGGWAIEPRKTSHGNLALHLYRV